MLTSLKNLEANSINLSLSNLFSKAEMIAPSFCLVASRALNLASNSFFTFV